MFFLQGSNIFLFLGLVSKIKYETQRKRTSDPKKENQELFMAGCRLDDFDPHSRLLKVSGLVCW